MGFDEHEDNFHKFESGELVWFNRGIHGDWKLEEPLHSVGVGGSYIEVIFNPRDEAERFVKMMGSEDQGGRGCLKEGSNLKVEEDEPYYSVKVPFSSVSVEPKSILQYIGGSEFALPQSVMVRLNKSIDERGLDQGPSTPPRN